jgi:hypothetical protein
MPTIVDFPTVVKAALDVFGDLFANEPERRHFAEYLTGLMIADKKTVSGINREFAVTTDQSCLNRWLNEVAWDVTALNDRRLAWLQEDGIVKLTQKIARLCSKGRTIESFGLSRAPVFSLFPAPQLSSRGRCLRAIFH